MNPKHHFDRKRRTAGLRRWSVTVNHSNKLGPRGDAIQLFQENTLARYLGVELETIAGKDRLLHPPMLLSHGLERLCLQIFHRK